MIIQSKIYNAILKAFLMHYLKTANIHVKRHFNGVCCCGFHMRKNVRKIFMHERKSPFCKADEKKPTNFCNVCF